MSGLSWPCLRGSHRPAELVAELCSTAPASTLALCSYCGRRYRHVNVSARARESAYEGSRRCRSVFHPFVTLRKACPVLQARLWDTTCGASGLPEFASQNLETQLDSLSILLASLRDSHPNLWLHTNSSLIRKSCLGPAGRFRAELSSGDLALTE